MSQTSIIAGALVVAYIVFITVHGELPTWLYLLGVGGNCSHACCNTGLLGVVGGSGGGTTSGGGGGRVVNMPGTGINIPPPVAY